MGLATMRDVSPGLGRGDAGSVAVAAEGLVVRRAREELLRELSFVLPRGRLVGLLGPSGSGKTTLMRAIAGTQRAYSGRIDVLGLRAGSPALRRRVGYASQDASIYRDLTVTQNLVYFRWLLGAPASDVRRVLAMTGLDDVAGTLVGRLSGGQRGRASLAVALLGDPAVLILDEPTVGLHPAMRAELWQLFRALADTGCTVLVSTHAMDEARRCDQLLLLRDGRLVAAGAVPGVLAAAKTIGIEDEPIVDVLWPTRRSLRRAPGSGVAPATTPLSEQPL